jgi:hypothetical protein
LPSGGFLLSGSWQFADKDERPLSAVSSGDGYAESKPPRLPKQAITNNGSAPALLFRLPRAYEPVKKPTVILHFSADHLGKAQIRPRRCEM